MFIQRISSQKICLNLKSFYLSIIYSINMLLVLQFGETKRNKIFWYNQGNLLMMLIQTSSLI